MPQAENVTGYEPQTACACGATFSEKDALAHIEACNRERYCEGVMGRIPIGCEADWREGEERFFQMQPRQEGRETRMAFAPAEAPQPATGLASTLQERGGRYGDSRSQAKISVALKHVMRMFPGWRRLSPHMQWALDFIADKISRILNGDPAYADNWHDIAGYASLVERDVSGRTA